MESQPPASTPASAPAGPSAAPAVGPYGILISPPSAGTYAVSIVALTGRVVASVQASAPLPATCANAAAALVPLPVSASNSRVYFMDAQGNVRTIAPDGTLSQGPVISLPAGTASRRSMFAVSPDDSRIAVVVDDFTAAGASTKMYMDQLQAGGSQTLIYSSSGAYTIWPVGWHGTTSLVVGKVPACTQGGGPGCCGPLEFHVVDPANANRRFVLGGPGCQVEGTPTPAGVLCATNTGANLISWTAVVTNSFPIHGFTNAYLSPGGSEVAVVSSTGTQVFPSPLQPWPSMSACGWIDDAHVLAGGDAQQQPRIGDATNGKVVPVAAQGDCGGRIPGSL